MTQTSAWAKILLLFISLLAFLFSAVYAYTSDSSLSNSASLTLAPLSIVVTVDGDIHAVRRSTGDRLWSLSESPNSFHPHPLVSSPPPNSSLEDDIYFVEPTGQGAIYLLQPSSSLLKLPISLVDLVHRSPFTFSAEDTRIFVGRKHSTLLAIDIETGHLLGSYDPQGSFCPSEQSVTPNDSCDFEDHDHSAHSQQQLYRKLPFQLPRLTPLFISRTDYTLSIYSKTRGFLQMLNYTSYGPSSSPTPVIPPSYPTGPGYSHDGRSIHSSHDGSLVCFNYEHSSIQWSKSEFEYPAAAVYDVVLPSSMPSAAMPVQPSILPQPYPDPLNPRSAPFFDWKSPSPSPSQSSSASSISTAYIGRINTNHFYALSDQYYPLVALDSSPSSSCIPRISQDIVDPQRRSILGIHSVQFSTAPFPLSTLFEDSSVPNQWDHHLSIDPKSPKTLEPPVDQQSPSYVTQSLNIVKSCFYIALPALTVFGVFFLSKKEIPTRSDIHDVYNNNDTVQERIEFSDSSTGTTSAPAIANIPNQHDGSLSSHNRTPSLNKDLPDLPREMINVMTDGQADENGGPDDITDHPGKRRRRRGKNAGARARAAAAAAGAGQKSPTNEKSSNEATIVNGKQHSSSNSASITNLNPVDWKDSTHLGTGSNGTTVHRATFQGRAVAVKKIVKASQSISIASREVALLQESDDHPNVIRYFYQYQDVDFHYIVLELCPATLEDLISGGDRGQKQNRDLAEQLWVDVPGAMKQIVSGISHLHSLNIVHRDIKPQNILVTPQRQILQQRIDSNINGASTPSSSSSAIPPAVPRIRMLISDFGLCKKLDFDKSSYAQTNAAGSNGYRAPEVLRGIVNLDEIPERSRSSKATTIEDTATATTTAVSAGGETDRKRLTKKVDIFSLGCLFYYVLTRGEHPFGGPLERDSNIIKGNMVTDGLSILGDEEPIACDLVVKATSSDPLQRPAAETLITHLFFWNANKKLRFLCDASDRFEVLQRDPPDQCLVDLEEKSANILGGKEWQKALDKAFQDNLGKYRKYEGSSVRDLLRVLRNKKHHYQDLPEELQEKVGSLPTGYLSYFTRRFPKLLVHIFQVVNKHYSTDDMLSQYFSTEI